MTGGAADFAIPVMEFSALAGCPIRLAMTTRVPGLACGYDKAQVMGELMPLARRVADQLAPGRLLVTAEQTHGKELAVIDADLPGAPVAVVDGLLSARSDVVLGIAVADCCPVWLWAPDGTAFAVVHAGRKGSEAGIAAAAALELAALTGYSTSALGAYFGPCIRPPAYEVDIPALLRRQLNAVGLVDHQDCGFNTAADLGRFYSYRMEKGNTGRMLALGWRA